MGKGSSIDLLHLVHDIFDRFGHQAHEGSMSRPVHRISETFDERCRQGDRNPLFLGMRRRQHRRVRSIENEVVDG